MQTRIEDLSAEVQSSSSDKTLATTDLASANAKTAALEAMMWLRFGKKRKKE